MGVSTRNLVAIVAALSMALAATSVLLLAHGDREVSLLIYLPGITLIDYLFGLTGGISAVLFSVLGSMWYRVAILNVPFVGGNENFVAAWEEEFILLAVGLFVVWLMEMRRKSGEAAASHRVEISLLLQNMADAALIFDHDGRLISMNPAAQTLLGRTPQELLGRPVEQLVHIFRVEPADKLSPSTILDAIRYGKVARLECSLFDHDRNRHIEVMGSAVPLRDIHHNILGAMLLLTDVTDLKMLQARMVDNARHLAIAQMVAGLTHDFNNILGIVRRAVTLLEMKADDPVEERSKYTDMIQRAVLNGTETIARLREYLSGGTGVMQTVDLNLIAREAIELTRPLWKVRPNVQVEEDLRPVHPIRGNPVDLRRVITNLIFNAVEALGEQGGRVCVRTESEGAVVRCSVEDTGPGIPLELQTRLFQPYFTTKTSGTGLGLFGAQKIILAHGGNLTFYSELGRGTRFNIELPSIEHATEAA
jgi:two-component system sensor histidine kinase AtoS